MRLPPQELQERVDYSTAGVSGGCYAQRALRARHASSNGLLCDFSPRESHVVTAGGSLDCS